MIGGGWHTGFQTTAKREYKIITPNPPGTQELSFGVCTDCGAVVLDVQLHDDWHEGFSWWFDSNEGEDEKVKDS